MYNCINMVLKVIVLFLFVSVLSIEGKRFTRCQLARELMKTRLIDKTFLSNWVCLAEKVSNRDTRAFVVTPGGKKSYGIFQIPSRWCREGKKGGECNVACESLLDDDIRDDTACAVSIFHKEGFKYWSKWDSRCKNDKLITQEIYKCPDLNRGRVKPEPDSQSEVLKTKKQHTKNTLERWGLFKFGAIN